MPTLKKKKIKQIPKSTIPTGQNNGHNWPTHTPNHLETEPCTLQCSNCTARSSNSF